MNTDLTDLARAPRPSARVLDDGDVVAGQPAPEQEDWLESLEDAFLGLRRATTKEAMAELGQPEGFRLEDAAALVIAVPQHVDADHALRWLRRRLSKDTVVSQVPTSGTLGLAARFRPRRGWSPTRAAYQREPDGRVRVEAFELHIVEHCNLRCSSCCNMSPLVAKRTLSTEEVAERCAQLAEVLVADVFKIMGGEPLLHPDPAGVLRAIRRTRIGDKVRLFTNGLLLHRQGTEFWEALDELTISSYSSAPVKPAVLSKARELARKHDVVLNIKEVSRFSQVLSPAFQGEPAAVQQTYERCWLRHRCLMARKGRFYMCTRAAYADDFLERVDHEPLPEGFVLDRSDDGIPLEGPDLAGRVAAYLNRPEHLGACHYCHGGDGPTEPHSQLRRDDVRAGRLSAALESGTWTRE